MTKIFSYRDRPLHQGPYALEKLTYTQQEPNYASLPTMQQMSFLRPEAPLSIVNAMDEYQAMMDAIREGVVKQEVATIPSDPVERSQHLKSFGYFSDASMVGTCAIPKAAWLSQPFVNPSVDRLSNTLATKQVKTLASGIDVILAMLREAMQAPPKDCQHHSHALVFLYEYPRDPEANEAGTDWIVDAQAQRAALRASETASVLSAYIRSLGYQARAHSACASDIDLQYIAVASGLACIEEGGISNPYLGNRFGLAVVTTDLE